MEDREMAMQQRKILVAPNKYCTMEKLSQHQRMVQEAGYLIQGIGCKSAKKNEKKI